MTDLDLVIELSGSDGGLAGQVSSATADTVTFMNHPVVVVFAEVNGALWEVEEVSTLRLALVWAVWEAMVPAEPVWIEISCPVRRYDRHCKSRFRSNSHGFATIAPDGKVRDGPFARRRPAGTATVIMVMFAIFAIDDLIASTTNDFIAANLLPLL